MQRSPLMAERHDSDVVDLYHRDFRAWALEQAQALHRAAESRVHDDANALQEAVAALDYVNLSEELASLGRSESRELRQRLTTIVEHLLKAQHSPAPRPRAGWRNTVRRDRIEVSHLVADSPSLEAELPDLLGEATENAVKLATAELADRGEGEARELARAMREAVRDYTPDRVLDPDWWPPMERGDTPPADQGAPKRPPTAPPKRGDTKRGRS